MIILHASLLIYVILSKKDNTLGLNTLNAIIIIAGLLHIKHKQKVNLWNHYILHLQLHGLQ